MKKFSIYFTILVGFFFTANIFSQAAGDYRSAAVLGNWSSASSWQTYNGSSWLPASIAPDGLSNTITIQSGHKITVDVPLSIGAVTIVVDGYLKDSMVITYPSLYTVNVNGTFELAHATASGQGLPTATWNTGSTCKITGITTSTTGSNANQDFYNFELDCPNWSGNLNFGWGGTSTPSPTTIYGDVIVKNTGPTGRWQWCAPTSGTIGSPNSVSVTVMGNVLIDGSASDANNKVAVTSNGTGNNYTEITISIHGNVNVIGNSSDVTWTNYAISRGSQGGTGTSVWNIFGDFSMSNATTQNSNVGGAKFVFKKSGLQTLNFSNVYYASSGVNFDILTGSTLQLNSNLNIVGTLNLNGGIINSSTSNLLIMGGNYSTSSFNSGTLVGGSSSSYVNGPMGYLNIENTSKTCLFTIGKNGKYRPVTLNVTQDVTIQTLYTAELFNVNPPANTLPGTLDLVSSVRYFIFTKGTGANITTASVQFNYESDDGVSDYNNLRIAKDNAGSWVNLGGVGTANGTGSITSTVNFTSMSNFVLANATGGGNLLQAPKILTLISLIEGLYNSGTNTMVSDTVKVELRNSTSPFGLVDQSKAVLNPSGSAAINFFSAADATSYYVVVKHRNAVETWSASGQVFSGGVLSYNFTTGSGQAYGSNMVMKGTKWCMYSGDVNQDGVVDLTDVATVDIDNLNFVSGYTVTDVNGDDLVDISDLSIVDTNNLNFISKITP